MTNEELQKAYDLFRDAPGITTEQVYMVGKMSGTIMRLRHALIELVALSAGQNSELETRVFKAAKKGLGVSDTNLK